MLHGMTAHEGAGGDVPVCSPWTSALCADAVWEDYVHSADTAALEFLASMGRFVADVGLYDEDGQTVPWYLVSTETEFSEGADIDTAATSADGSARGVGREGSRTRPGPLRAVAGDLVAAAINLDSWHRPNGPDSGQTEWRLSPERKFNWWFGTTSDLGWLLDAVDNP